FERASGSRLPRSKSDDRRCARTRRRPVDSVGTRRLHSPPLTGPSTKRRHGISIALFALAFALRAIYLTIARSPVGNYNWLLAGSLLTDGTLSIDGVKTTALEPLYPLFLAAARAIVGDRPWAVQVIQCGVGALGAPLLFRLT